MNYLKAEVILGSFLKEHNKNRYLRKIPNLFGVMFSKVHKLEMFFSFIFPENIESSVH